MPNMEYMEPSFQQYQTHHDQLSQQVLSAYNESQQNLHNYTMAQPTMIAMPTTTKTNETKPRLGKEEVDILEREFKKNPKPTTQTKRQFAEDMGVDLARINNWFQNRRAKRKQEKKQEAYEAGQNQDALGYSEPSSPDYFNGNGYFSENRILPLQHSATFPLMSGPPPPVAPYNPQYTDPSSASMESLQRTMAAAQAGSQQDFHTAFVGDHEVLTSFGTAIQQVSTNGDRAQFPPSDESSFDHFDGNQSFSYPSTFATSLYGVASQSMPELHASPGETSSHTPTPFNDYSSSSGPSAHGPHIITTFPSQLLPSQSHDGLPSCSNDSSDSQSPEDSNSSTLAIGFKYDVPESDDSSPPAPTIPFKSPPPPTDIASRRKKVHVKPAALTAETLRSRPPMGPRTVSHAEGFRRPAESPVSSPMRRIVSAGGNRNVLTGRVSKSGVESAQRSPINLGGFADAGAFLEHNYHTIRHPPSLTAGSSLNSSLAPPTPMSPREREMTLAKRENSRSTASPSEGGMNFVFNANVPGCFTIEGDQNLASPPETPQAHMSLHPSISGWPAGIEFQDKQWHYEVPDEPLYTPAQDVFPLELHMPQPSYLTSMSQPVTPAFGQHFNPNFMFGHESPQYKHDSPQFTLSTQQAEYSFPDNLSHNSGMSSTSPMTKQKTFQFSNTTAADFSEK